MRGHTVEFFGNYIMSLKYAKIVVILSFLCFKLMTAIYSVAKNGVHKSILYVVALLMYSTFAFVSFKGDKIGQIATYLLIISILFTSGGCFVAVFVAPTEQFAFKAASILAGLYFGFCGALLAITEKRRKNMARQENRGKTREISH